MKTITFSIITVTYNAESTVESTLNSVAEQTCDDYEHLIIDGASTDRTLEIVEAAKGKARRKVISEPDGGLYDAMNKGISHASGRFLIFLNSGDRFHSADTLKIIKEAIENNPDADIIYGQTDLVDSEGRFIAKRHLDAPSTLTLKDFSRGMVVCHQAFVVNKEIAPFFSLKYRFSADYEWCILCLQHSRKNVYTGCVLIDYLVEGLSTKHRSKSLRERFTIMSTYYGFWPTLWRHFGFIGRFRRHQRELKKLRTKN